MARTRMKSACLVIWETLTLPVATDCQGRVVSDLEDARRSAGTAGHGTRRFRIASFILLLFL